MIEEHIIIFKKLQLVKVIITQLGVFFVFCFNWDSLHARLNSHYEAWSDKKRSTKKITVQKICLERT